MPRNGSGVYSLPAGSTVSNGDTSDATDVNTPLSDIASDLNVARPVSSGGTGATTAADARTNLGVNRTNLGITEDHSSAPTSSWHINGDKLEMWGSYSHPSGASGEPYTLNLPKTFASTNYTISLTTAYQSGSGLVNTVNVGNGTVTTSSFGIWNLTHNPTGTSISTATTTVFWRVVGEWDGVS